MQETVFVTPKALRLWRLAILSSSVPPLVNSVSSLARSNNGETRPVSPSERVLTDEYARFKCQLTGSSGELEIAKEAAAYLAKSLK